MKKTYKIIDWEEAYEKIFLFPLTGECNNNCGEYISIKENKAIFVISDYEDAIFNKKEGFKFCSELCLNTYLLKNI